MASNSDHSPLGQILLGKATEYVDQYEPSILYPVPRQLNRDQLGLDDTQPLPFVGGDIWHGYELSWLNPKGKPVVALARFYFDYAGVNIVESKSFKLYLNSFNQTRFDSSAQVEQILQRDLAATAMGQVTVTLYTPEQLSEFTPNRLPGQCLDDLDIEIDDYQFNPAYLKTGSDPSIISETLHSHLLKSNCLITHQPDWASVVISYQGTAIDHPGLLRYLISFRQHNEFHEQCVERIFHDLWRNCKPQKLSVVAYYTRRGGLDISPWRSSEIQPFKPDRINRQ